MSLFIVASQFAYSQSRIEGRIFSKKDNSPIPYAHILNYTTGKGTIANTDGFFRLELESIKDSIVVSSIGFVTQTVQLSTEDSEIVVYLSDNQFQLGEVVLKAKDDSFLYELIRDAAKGGHSGNLVSKGYYELRSFKNDFQTELVEAYYNADLSGYRLNALNYKIGRVGLRALNFGYSISIESSKAMLLLDIEGGSQLFPDTPIEHGKSRMKKRFYLELQNKYTNAAGDSIFVITYYPKDTLDAFFSGTIWVNQSQLSLLKVDMKCEDCGVSPFIPYVGTQTIEQVDMMITKEFAMSKEKGAYLKAINFDYTITYDLAGRSNADETATVRTEAIIYLYDFNDPFILPYFDFVPDLSDYRKVSVMDYNEFFWKNHDEYQMSSSDNRTETYYSNPATETVDEVFSEGITKRSSLFESGFRRWSEKRLVFKPDSSRPLEYPVGGIIADKYDIVVQHFLDINTYNDSTDVVTAVVFDPFQSFYDLPVDNQTLAFINIYFDLCEIKRRELHDKIVEVADNPAEVNRVYSNFKMNFDRYSQNFFRAVDRGTNEDALREYNQIVADELGIDNIELFEIYRD
jgi:hypothetical protein